MWLKDLLPLMAPYSRNESNLTFHNYEKKEKKLKKKMGYGKWGVGV